MATKATSSSSEGISSSVLKTLNIALGKQLGQGTFGSVFKARSLSTGLDMAVKICVPFDDRSDPNADESNGLDSSALREVSILKDLNHINVVQLQCVAFDDCKIVLLLEYVETDLFKFIYTKSPRNDINNDLIRSIAYQIGKAIQFCHDQNILHRDLKPSNVLFDVSHQIVKLADFGLSRRVGPSAKQYTREVVTLWYRPPELLLGLPYGYPLDIWGYGLVVAELIARAPLFNGECEIDTLFMIWEALGTANESNWHGVTSAKYYQSCLPQFSAKGLFYRRDIAKHRISPLAVQFVKTMVIQDPQARPSISSSLSHVYFHQIEKSLSPYMIDHYRLIETIADTCSCEMCRALPYDDDDGGMTSRCDGKDSDKKREEIFHVFDNFEADINPSSSMKIDASYDISKENFVDLEDEEEEDDVCVAGVKYESGHKKMSSIGSNENKRSLSAIGLSLFKPISQLFSRDVVVAEVDEDDDDEDDNDGGAVNISKKPRRTINRQPSSIIQRINKRRAGQSNFGVILQDNDLNRQETAAVSKAGSRKKIVTRSMSSIAPTEGML